MMYDEIVKRLRTECTLPYETLRLMRDAADAIEELATFKEQITDGHFYCMRDGVLYEAKVEPPNGKVFHLPQIEFQEPPKEE